MSTRRWISSLHQAFSPRRNKATPPTCRTLPRLEILEDRTAPANFATTATIVSAGPATYGFSNETEAVTAQATYTAANGATPGPCRHRHYHHR